MYYWQPVKCHAINVTRTRIYTGDNKIKNIKISQNNHWEQELQEWYKQPSGQYILELEKKLLDTILPTCFGYYLLQIGGCASEDMARSSPINQKIFLQSNIADAFSGRCNLVGEMEDLPIESNSVDVLIVNHALEFSSDPHSLLREIERVLRPEGYLILFSFCPGGWYGLRRLFGMWRGQAPWNGKYFPASRVADWLNLLGMPLLSQRHYALIPPINNAKFLNFFKPLDNWFNGFSLMFGAGAYLLLAKKQVSTLTPMKPSWWQRNVVGVRTNAPLRPTTRNNHD